MQQNVGARPGGRANGPGSRPRPTPALVHHGAVRAVEAVAPERGTDVVHECGLQSFPGERPAGELVELNEKGNSPVDWDLRVNTPSHHCSSSSTCCATSSVTARSTSSG